MSATDHGIKPSDQVRVFVECVYDAGDIVEVRRLPSGKSSWHKAGELHNEARSLSHDNQVDSIYVGANPRRRHGGTTADEVALARSLFADWDGGITPDEARGRWRDAGLPDPTIMLATGGGVHGYWRLDAPITDLASWAVLQKRLIATVESDPKPHDAPRVMRLPGFRNLKPDRGGRFCTILNADPNRVYPLDELPLADMPAPKPREQSRPSTEFEPSAAQYATSVERCRAFVAKMPPAIDGKGGHNVTLTVACELFRFGLKRDDAAEILNEYNIRCQPPWTDEELAHKLDDGEAKVREAKEFGCRVLPEIKTGPFELRVTDETIAALSRRKDIYQRGGVLCEIRESPEPPPCIIRPEGGVRAAQLPRPRLRELISASAVFLVLKKTDEGEEWAQTRVPSTVVEQVESRGVWKGIRTLEGIVTSPQYLRDGSVLMLPGYHERSGLYFATDASFPPVAESPSLNDAIKAREALLEVIADFPMDEVSKAAWLALVLTGAARHAIDGPTPLFAIDSNVRGSGKSLAADSHGIIHTGRQLPRTTAARDDDEFRKRITSILLAGESDVLLDNVNGVLGCASLDALLTSTTWTDRILGQSAMTAAIPAKSTWICTGNNLQFQADTARRALRLRLVSPLENPEERTGFKHPELLPWVRQQRGRLATAAVTILRAWHVAGRPAMGLVPWGSFDSWSRIVRSAVVWVEMADPGESRQEVQRESDREAMLLRMLLDAWQDADPSGHGLTVSDAAKRAGEGDVGLSAVFAELTGPTGKINLQSIGQRLRHLRGRVCGGRCFDRRDTRQGAAWVVKLTSESPEGTEKCDSSTSSASSSNPPARAPARDHTEGVGSTGAIGATGAACDHLNPASWRVDGERAYCPGCNRLMGFIREPAA